MPLTQPSTIQGDLSVNGKLRASSMVVPPGSVTNDSIAGGQPGTFIDPTKMGQQYRVHYSQPNTAATTETRPAYITFGNTGQIIDVRAAIIGVALGAAVVTIDLKKNGVSVLSAPITINSATAARTTVPGTINSGNLVAGDFLEWTITAAAGGGTLPTGVLCSATLNEDPY